MTVRSDLFGWLSELPLWQQDLARRLAARPQLAPAEFEEAQCMVRDAFNALGDDEEAPAPQAIALEDLPETESAAESPKLLEFGNMRGVGLVAADQALQFKPDGLTVIYGPNAVGKTTYVRGLKRVCRAVDCEEEILGNVFASSAAGQPAPSAKVELLVDGDRRAQQLDLQDPTSIGLDGVSVFDARCAELYVDDDNGIAYVPSALVVLTRLAATQDSMRQDFLAQVGRLEALAPAVPELGSATEAKRRVETLSQDTDLNELREFATLDDTEKVRLTEVRAVIAAADANTTGANAQAASADASQAAALAVKLRDLGSRVETSTVEELKGLARQDADAKTAVKLAAQEFAELPVPNVGSEPWQRLWRAACEFSERQQAGFPPRAGEHCPLCLQQVDTGAAAMMAHFQEHVQSTINEQADRADRALAVALERIEERHLGACRTDFLESLKTRHENLHSTIEDYLDAVGRRMSKLRADPAGITVLPILDDPAEDLEQWATTREAEARDLLAAQNPARAQQLRAELADLDAREKLRARLNDAHAWVATLKRIAALRRARAALATNRITTQQRTLSETLVSGTLAAELREEVRRLRCEHLPVDLEPHGTVGETQVRLRLVGAQGAPRVSEILSEGEHRALALAFFLAEVGMARSDGGIIVDDPVSSLDDSRREYIAERLVAEAESRQVIVFMHDIAFLTDLTDRSKVYGREPFVQGVWRVGREVGRVDDRPPFATMNLKARLGLLNEEVEQWDKKEPAKNFDEAWRRVCDFYGQLRKTWERAVEERLFRGVVQRFQRDVKTLALKDVDLKREHINAITAGMTRCSQFVHDAPPGTGTGLPDRAELAKDLQQLQDFEKESRAKH